MCAFAFRKEIRNLPTVDIDNGNCLPVANLDSSTMLRLYKILFHVNNLFEADFVSPIFRILFSSICARNNFGHSCPPCFGMSPAKTRTLHKILF